MAAVMVGTVTVNGSGSDGGDEGCDGGVDVVAVVLGVGGGGICGIDGDGMVVASVVVVLRMVVTD